MSHFCTQNSKCLLNCPLPCRLLAMALKWLATADKIAIEFLKQFGVSLRQGKSRIMNSIY